MQQHTFDPTVSTVLSVSKFGKLQQKLTYYTDGTIKTVADEKNQTTTFSNYKRGIAQRIDYPDTSFETAVVNNLGKITSLTNEVNFTHVFGYDDMGRLASITYPSDAKVVWNQTTLSFGPVAISMRCGARYMSSVGIVPTVPPRCALRSTSKILPAGRPSIPIPSGPAKACRMGCPAPMMLSAG
jgi:YD repeat-containing protein